MSNIEAWRMIQDINQDAFLCYLDTDDPVCEHCGCYETTPGVCHDCNTQPTTESE